MNRFKKLIVGAKRAVPLQNSGQKVFCGAVLGLILLFCAKPAFATGTVEVEVPPVNPQWVFAITSVDVSAMPVSKQSVGAVIEQNIYRRLLSISSRNFGEAEFDYYQNKAWALARTTAAKKLADKRTQRDNVIFQGNPEWKYKKSVKTIDDEIKTLEEAYQEADTKPPVLTKSPVFKFIDANISGTFPAPPQEGGEERFCATQKADGFLLGSASEYHGRVLLRLKIWSLALNRYIYEKIVLFSAEDAAVAADEIAPQLAAAISGAESSIIVVNTNTPNHTIFIGNNIAEAGPEGIFQAPGKTTLTVSAPGYESVTLDLEIKENEKTEVSLTLPRIDMAPINIMASDKKDEVHAPVYKGSLYLGKTPFPANIPVNTFDYFRVEEGENMGALAVFENATTPDTGATVNKYQAIKSRVLPNPNDKPVEKARDRMYLSYGIFWIALPVVMVSGFPWSGGMYDSAAKAGNATQAGVFAGISWTALVAVLGSVGWTVYNAVQYFGAANASSPTLMK